MSFIQNRFFSDEDFLNKKFSYDKAARQMSYLFEFTDQFDFPPPISIQKVAKLIFQRLIEQTQVGESLQNTLVYVQARELAKEYISLKRLSYQAPMI